ncbi:FG-GAP-like repeat-containing protein [Reichenbachiella carrageenanivorans]|uniref:FG-GAP-like repeat-containing protein n=1 Tax=Reichenbachiella carrageenanivorans TaxID=2979869 RepID=A0ABY6CVI6_9BACT|nr:FG-GAP-like repeat-containing protein [Reichenbachiella carrageenanivorans]UXX77924.1 FG-GAP-like repeat-containing protein [Reichenbachiella carrageenanivorans]
MKKPQLRFSGGTVRYRLFRKYRNLYRRMRVLLASENPCEREVKRLTSKLQNVYHRLERALLRIGVQVAGTALALTLTATLSQAQTLTFEKQVFPGSEVLFDGIELDDDATPTFVDIDNDGDMDLFVGKEYGYYVGFYYYENVGSAAAPHFKKRTGADNPLGLVNDIYNSNVTFADIDADGDLDALVGEENGGLFYYKNTGTASAPAFEEQTGENNPFDGISTDYDYSNPALVDIDADGDFDLFIGDYYGYIYYYKNTGTASAPAFEAQTGGASPFGSDSIVDGYATPTFVDIDNDGDFDMVSGNEEEYIQFFKNTGSASAPDFIELEDRANPFSLIGYNEGGDRSHPAFADLDGDGDLDLLVGDDDGYLTYYKNKGTASEPDFGTTPFSGLHAPRYATPTFVDFDGDGDLDVLTGSINSDILYYKNTGTATHPAFEEQTDEANPFDDISVLEYSSISLADLDADGDLDALAGDGYGYIIYLEKTDEGFLKHTSGSSNPFGFEYFNEWVNPELVDIDDDGDFDVFLGTSYGSVLYYKNTGSASNPAFTEQTGADNPFGDDQIVNYKSSPTFGDFDGDGDLDAVSGDEYGYIHYFRNTGTVSAPAFVKLKDSNNPFDGIEVDDYSFTTAADLDNDGDMDLLVGEGYGSFHYFKNTGTASAPAFDNGKPAPNPLNPLDLVSNEVEYSVPTFVDIDGDGDMDAFVGTAYDGISFYKNTGTTATAAFSEQTETSNPFHELIRGSGGYPEDEGENYRTLIEGPVEEPGLTHISKSNPIFVDMDGDGDMDAIVGSSGGNIYYFENTGTASAPAFIEQTDEDNPFGNLGNEEGGELIPGRIQEGFSVSRSAPQLKDLDADGDLDLLVGSSQGPLYYFENTGSVSAPAFSQLTGANNPFDGIGGYQGGDFRQLDEGGESESIRYSKPALEDFDMDGDLDLLVGSKYGTIHYYINTGSASAPAFEKQTGSANPFDGEILGVYSTPAAVDIDGDGDMDVFVGTYENGISFYKNTTNSKPVITSNGGGDAAAVSVDENQTAVTTVTATDKDGDAIAYSISNGADKALFSIDASTGVLTFKAAPDFEAPADANADNQYVVEVSATDNGDGSLSDVQTLTISVKDVNDNVTSVDDLERSISVYPNPTNSLITVNGLSSNIQSIRLLDFSGKILLEKAGQAQEMSIDLSAYQAGIYIMRIQTDKALLSHKIEKY